VFGFILESVNFLASVIILLYKDAASIKLI